MRTLLLVALLVLGVAFAGCATDTPSGTREDDQTRNDAYGAGGESAPDPSTDGSDADASTSRGASAM